MYKYIADTNDIENEHGNIDKKERAKKQVDREEQVPSIRTGKNALFHSTDSFLSLEAFQEQTRCARNGRHPKNVPAKKLQESCVDFRAIPGAAASR